MEIHKFLCDCCGKELNKKMVTISQHYSDQSWDGLDEEWSHYTVDKKFHLCPECWSNIEKLVIKK